MGVWPIQLNQLVLLEFVDRALCAQINAPPLVAPHAKSAAEKVHASLIPLKKARTAKKASASLADAFRDVLLMAVARAQCVVLPGNATLILPRLLEAAACARNAKTGNALLMTRKNVTVDFARAARASLLAPIRLVAVTFAKNAILPTGHVQPMIPKPALAEPAKEDLANVVTDQLALSLISARTENACWAARS
jgi:hypothetical protein